MSCRFWNKFIGRCVNSSLATEYNGVITLNICNDYKVDRCSKYEDDVK